MEAQSQTEPVGKSPGLQQQQLCEAALYVSGRPLDLKTIGSIIGARSEEKIKSLVRTIIERYEKSESPIQVLELPDGRFVMQLKPEIAKHVRKLSNRPLLTTGPLRTLSYIALRQPVAQSRVIAVRGKLAYQHVKQLKDMDLISYEKLGGRSKTLRTTATFADYFNLNHDSSTMKRELRNILDMTGDAANDQQPPPSESSDEDQPV
ncbi:MAG TPA: SMC-Scp complex subunit ScpB [Candidatus Dormibacteraeota bacterium]|nr:SMC-Scp complex subunit ScpB [Candidatus Dormibacteraeota bacterium]